jgi:hypothetical protein
MNLYNQTFLHMLQQHHVAIEDFEIYEKITTNNKSATQLGKKQRVGFCLVL